MSERVEDINDINANDYYECTLLAGRLAPVDPGLWNRRLIHWAMSVEGFTNDRLVF
jgi:D-alanyl-D-alanine dipeptidase